MTDKTSGLPQSMTDKKFTRVICRSYTGNYFAENLSPDWRNIYPTLVAQNRLFPANPLALAILGLEIKVEE